MFVTGWKPRFLSKPKRERAYKNQVRSEACCGLTIINFWRARRRARGSSILARFFAASAISKQRFGLDLAPIVPDYPAPNQRLTNFCTPNRAHPRVRARDHQNSRRSRTLLRETLTNLYLRGPLTPHRNASACLR